jgi:hypothetical protein
MPCAVHIYGAGNNINVGMAILGGPIKANRYYGLRGLSLIWL